LVLLPLLLLVLIAGLYIVSRSTEHFTFLFGIAAFSIAYALHFFSVSSALCGVYIRESDEQKFNDLREKEYAVVTSAMCTLAGGLGILVSGGLCAVGCSTTLWRLPVIPLIYVAFAVLLFFSVSRYVFTQRKWPREARAIHLGKPRDAGSSCSTEAPKD